MVFLRVVLGIGFHPWKGKLRRHSKILVKVKSHFCFKRSTCDELWGLRENWSLTQGPLVASLPMNLESIQASDTWLVPSTSDAKPYSWWCTRWKDMKALWRKAWCKEISTMLGGRLKKESGPRWRKKEGKGLKLHWLKYLDVKLSPLKLSERAQKTHLTGLINRWVRCWNYFKTDAFLNCIQNTFQGS